MGSSRVTTPRMEMEGAPRGQLLPSAREQALISPADTEDSSVCKRRS